MKNISLTLIKSYQYISKLFPANCRYYPTCSEYAKWQFEFNLPHRAFYATSLRILRCNQLFSGGLDYPLVKYTPSTKYNLLFFNPSSRKIKVIYWLIPQNNHKKNRYYYVIKDFHAINRAT